MKPPDRERRGAGATATVDRVSAGGRELAIIIPSGFHSEGINFLTSPDYSQQLAYMHRPSGYRIDPHVHNAVQRTVTYTLEALFVRSGRVRLDLYGEDRQYVASRELRAGDIVLLTGGGHGLEMLEAAEIVEVKQGPYVGEHDKTRF